MDNTSLITSDYSLISEPNYLLRVTQESESGLYFSYRYVVFWKHDGLDHIIHTGHGNSNDINVPLSDTEKEDALMRAINKHRRGAWKK